VQVLFLQSHSTCFGRKRPSSGVFKTGTTATGTCVIVAGKSSLHLIRINSHASVASLGQRHFFFHKGGEVFWPVEPIGLLVYPEVFCISVLIFNLSVIKERPWNGKKSFKRLFKFCHLVCVSPRVRVITCTCHHMYVSSRVSFKLKRNLCFFTLRT